MTSSEPFKWRHFQSKIILLTVRWYLCYSLSYQDLEEMVLERGIKVDHTTIFRWVQAYSPEMDKRCQPHLKETNDSWKVNETYVKIKGTWKYLYRAIDSQGNTLDFMLSAKRDTKAAKRFFIKVLKGRHTVTPRVINVDKDAAYRPALKELKEAEALPKETELRQVTAPSDDSGIVVPYAISDSVKNPVMVARFGYGFNTIDATGILWYKDGAWKFQPYPQAESDVDSQRDRALKDSSFFSGLVIEVHQRGNLLAVTADLGYGSTGRAEEVQLLERKDETWRVA